MSKIVVFNLITLDGYFEGPGDDISWHNVDEEFNRFAVEQTGSAGGLIFGRKTYQLMASYWPTEQAMNDDPQVTRIMNEKPKLVFSNSLQTVDWRNTRLVHGDPAPEINRLKQQSGADWFVFGSGNLTGTLIQKGLIDEFRLLLNPVILGGGTPMFSNIQHPIKLKLVEERPFANGNVLLTYRPEESHV